MDRDLSRLSIVDYMSTEKKLTISQQIVTHVVWEEAEICQNFEFKRIGLNIKFM